MLDHRRIAMACLGAALAVGCTDDLPKITLIRQLEPLGQRAEVAGDPERSSPKPGETFTYRILTALPELEQDRSQLSTLMLECTEPEANSEVAPCQELVDLGERGSGPADEIDLSALGIDVDPEVLAALDCTESYRRSIGPLTLHCAVGEPVFELTAPAGARGDRFVSGVMCNGATARLDRERIGDFNCGGGEGDEEPRDRVAFFGTVKLQPEDEPDNHHPEVDGLRLTLEDEDWPAWPEDAPPSPDDCGSDEVPLVALSAEHTLGLHYEADRLERVDGEPETLELSVYATAGELERRFTVFRPDAPVEDGELSSELTWTAPNKADNDAYERRDPDDPVRFYIVARDLREGITLAERYLCLD